MSEGRERITAGDEWPGHLSHVQPTSTGVLAAGLLRKGALIEISAVAVLRDASK